MSAPKARTPRKAFTGGGGGGAAAMFTTLIPFLGEAATQTLKGSDKRGVRSRDKLNYAKGR